MLNDLTDCQFNSCKNQELASEKLKILGIFIPKGRVPAFKKKDQDYLSVNTYLLCHS